MDGGNSPSTAGMLLNQAHGVRDDLNDIFQLIDSVSERLLGSEPPQPTGSLSPSDPVVAPPMAGSLGELQSILRDCKRTCLNVRKVAERLNTI